MKDKTEVSCGVIIQLATYIAIFGLVLNSCRSQATLVDMNGERIAPVAPAALTAHAWYAEDMVLMPAGTEIQFFNKSMVTKHEGYYFSKRYQEFCFTELMYVLGGGKLENTKEARRQRFREYIRKGDK